LGFLFYLLSVFGAPPPPPPPPPPPSRSRTAVFQWAGVAPPPFGPSPPTPHVQLPIVTSNDFAPYLKAFSSSLAKFEQNHPLAQGTGDAGPLVGSSEKLADGGGGGGGGVSIVDLTCLQHVPDVFRSRQFDLKSPSTFAAVFGCPADVDSAGGSYGYDDDGDALLEQLHSHLDEVEAALMLGVRSRSSEFFAAIDELQLLSLDIASALQDTAVARTALATVDREVVGSALQVYYSCPTLQTLNP
jgi:hypothetical protein